MKYHATRRRKLPPNAPACLRKLATDPDAVVRLTKAQATTVYRWSLANRKCVSVGVVYPDGCHAEYSPDWHEGLLG